MDHVLTLIAPEAGALDDSMLGRVRSALLELGADLLSPSWLSPARAVDLPFTLLSADQAVAAAKRELAPHPVDVIAQPVRDRRKALLLADMDSTMVTGETLDELADFAGLKERIAAITARSMNGEIDFKDALRERVGLLRGLSADMLEATWRRVEFTPGGRSLIATMKANGAYTVLVSGGFDFFTGRVRTHCGFDADFSNRFEIEDGRLTGRVIDPILDRDAKLKTLIETAAARAIPLSRTMTVGDGANDLDMIRAAGLGVAFHAKPVVAGKASARIDHGDLRSLLYIQGYDDSEIIGD